MHQNPDVDAPRWLLLCRAVTLSLRPTSSEEGGTGAGGGVGGDDSGGRDEDDDDDDGGGGAGGGGIGAGSGQSVGVVGGTSSPTGSFAGLLPGSSGHSETALRVSQYVNLCRDRATEKGAQMQSARSKIKTVVLRLATVALAGLAGNPAHSDLHLARTLCQQALNDLEATTAVAGAGAGAVAGAGAGAGAVAFYGVRNIKKKYKTGYGRTFQSKAK